MEAQMHWIKGMNFSCHNRQHQMQVDTNAEHGGEDLAATPKELILNAMMACSAMDVVSILKKMRQPITTFKMGIEAEKNTEHPIHFKRAKLTYDLTGELELEKVVKAIDASLTKYCGVNYMMSKTCEITYELLLNGKVCHQGRAAFLDPVE